MVKYTEYRRVLYHIRLRARVREALRFCGGREHCHDHVLYLVGSLLLGAFLHMFRALLYRNVFLVLRKGNSDLDPVCSSCLAHSFLLLWTRSGFLPCPKVPVFLMPTSSPPRFVATCLSPEDRPSRERVPTRTKRRSSFLAQALVVHPMFGVVLEPCHHLPPTPIQFLCSVIYLIRSRLCH